MSHGTRRGSTLEPQPVVAFPLVPGRPREPRRSVDWRTRREPVDISFRLKAGLPGRGSGHVVAALATIGGGCGGSPRVQEGRAPVVCGP